MANIPLLVSSSPVPSFQGVASLHPWASIDPSVSAKLLERKAAMYRVLSVVAVVAITAIGLAVLGLSMIAGVATGPLSYALIALVLATPFLSVAASKAQARWKEFASLAGFERKVEANLHKLSQDGEALIRSLELRQPPLVGQVQAEANRPFLRLCARLLARKEEAVQAKELSDRQLRADANLGDRQIVLATRQIGWQNLEWVAAPAALEAALIAHLVQHPELQLRLSDIGQVVQKTFEERQFGRLYDNSDDFFRLNDGRVLTLAEVVADIGNIDALRIKLFPAN